MRKFCLSPEHMVSTSYLACLYFTLASRKSGTFLDPADRYKRNTCILASIKQFMSLSLLLSYYFLPISKFVLYFIHFYKSSVAGWLLQKQIRDSLGGVKYLPVINTFEGKEIGLDTGNMQPDQPLPTSRVLWSEHGPVASHTGGYIPFLNQSPDKGFPNKDVSSGRVGL